MTEFARNIDGIHEQKKRQSKDLLFLSGINAQKNKNGTHWSRWYCPSITIKQTGLLLFLIEMLN